MNRKRVVLAALLCVLAVCVIYAYLSMPRLETAPPRSASGKAKAVDVARNGDSVASAARIDFSYLDDEPAKFMGAKRDIFRFGSQRPAKSTLPAPGAKSSTADESAQPVIPIPLVTPIEVVQRSLSQFTFLGFLEKAGEKTVFLSSSGELFLVKQGEQFGLEKEFQVDSIQGNLLKVTHSGREGLIEIPLIEKKKLQAAVSAPAVLPPSEVQMPPVNNRIFRPQTNVQPRPVPTPGAEETMRETEETMRELIEEYNPQETQEQPAEKDIVEGEVNGAKQ